MRKKALLVGANASFEGPWVNLEEGTWLVEPPSGVEIEVGEYNDLAKLLGGGSQLEGPCRIRAIISDDYDGPEVCLSVREVA